MEDVRAVLYENVRAANAEDLDRYMATIHTSSPSYATTESTLASAFDTYDLAYELTQANVLEQSDSEATISFVLTTRKISGPAFRDNRVTGTMTLRKEDGVWKIYDQRISNIEYLE
jgi:ketosteroid isomerase-like protein